MMVEVTAVLSCAIGFSLVMIGCNFQRTAQLAALASKSITPIMSIDLLDIKRHAAREMPAAGVFCVRDCSLFSSN